jgi:zinc protease
MSTLSSTVVTATRRLAAKVTCALAVAVAPCWGQATPTVRPLEYARFVLQNGLIVLLNEDHSTPLVAVDVWYHFGAKDEVPGRFGFAHLCEHLMGEGSPNIPGPEKVLIESIGGTSVFWANTTEDITHSYYTLPSHQLETALWLESDRMAAPLSQADAAHMATVRETVRQERTQRRDNPVFGLAELYTIAALFHGGPYANDPLVPMNDLDSANVNEVKAFCTPYYTPNNAVLSLSGDFSSAHAKTLIEKYFGDIHRGNVPSHPQIPAAETVSPRRLVYEDPRARVSTLRLAWPSVGFANPDRLPLVALAWLLSRDRTGLLAKLLQYDRPLATRVIATNFDFEKGGLFQIDVFPRPDASMSTIETLVDSVLTAFSAQSIRPDDLEAFKRSNAVLAITSLETRAARADTLAHGEIFAGDPVAYAKQVNATAALTPGDIARVARRYLGANRMVMSMIPTGRLESISKPELPYTRLPASAGKR